MKTLLTLTIGLLSFTSAIAQTDVDITISYRGKAVCNYDVELMHGDVVIAKGKTDNHGHVLFEAAQIIDKQVDLHATKKNGDADFEFSVKGYLTLDDNNAAELQLEKLLEEMAADSGMPESLFAEGWGLMALDCH